MNLFYETETLLFLYFVEKTIGSNHYYPDLTVEDLRILKCPSCSLGFANISGMKMIF